MKINNQDTINKLIKLLDDNKLSVVVGAGFSKNASHKYLSWKELLKDMIIEMYGSTARRSVEYDRVRGGRKEKEFWNRFVNQIIKENGYLTIASEYIKRHGYREVIDEYIEARTPLVIEEQDKFYALLNNDKYEVDLITHKYLLDIKWNNVYTFNYDNLLDVVGGTERHKKLEQQKKGMEYRISEIESDIRNIKEILENLRKEKEKIELQLQDAFNIKESLVSSNADAEKLKSINESLKSLEDKYNELIIEKETLKLSIDTIETKQEDLFLLVDNSFDLSLRKNRNIIKLHGTIRTRENNKYGFDNDPHCHYVITADDYEKYLEKHEAFVNLMRIALLQDSFCLIGFSGDDPNFISWLDWIKDILDRRSAEDNEEKVFFIDVTGYPLSESKKLFFKNHYIKHLPLFDNPQEATPSNIKRELHLLFEKLNSEGRAVNAVLEYNDFWRHYKFDLPKEDDSYLCGYSRELIRKIWENRRFNRLPRLEYDYADYKQRVIDKLIQLVGEGVFDEDAAKLFILALKGNFIPLDAYFNISSEQFTILNNLIKPYVEISEELKLLYIRSLNLNGKDVTEFTSDSTSDAIIYESILSAAFRLDFTSISQQLDCWNPEELCWKSRKIAFKSYFKSKIEATYRDIEKVSETNIQEYGYFIDTLLIASYSVEWSRKSDKFYLTYNKKREIINKKLNKIDDNSKYLIEKLSKEKVDITPRSNTSIKYQMGGNMALKYSIQFLQVMIESGLSLQTQNVIYIKKEDWYRVFENIYNRYPFPCLFYSLQYGTDENFMKRLAEDYVYSNELSDNHAEILLYCLQAYQNSETPFNIKQGILSFTPLFFRIVPAKFWRREFEKIIKSFDLNNRNINREIINPEYNFLRNGLLYISSQALKRDIVNKILSLEYKIDHVDNLILIAAKSGLSEKFKKQVKCLFLDQLINNVDQISQYFVLFNLQDLLSTEQVDKLVSRLLDFDFKTCSEEKMFEASSQIAKSHPSLSRKIENEIIESNLLWHNGISFDENRRRIISYGSGFIKISIVQKHLNFSKDSIIKIYTQLFKSLTSITDVINGSLGDENYFLMMEPYWSRLLLEMQLFLRTNQSILQLDKDFEKVTKLLEQSYYQLNKMNSIMDGLISSNDYQVRESIQKLVYEVESFGVQKFTPEYLVIVNRIVSKAHPGLNSCINHFASVMMYYHKDFNSNLFKPFVNKILEKYAGYFSNQIAIWDISAKKEDVENAMLQLNKVAIEWGIGNKYWSSHKRIFRFTDVSGN